ncbi:MAG: zf-HC2 domain-containing protein [Proteobacteria bacterium]|nr:zf-HC2 domain-containing protein [Pseudomonadota bacterium]
MTCRHTEQQLQAWLDGELSPSLAHALKEHVRGCALCNARLEGLKQLFDAVGDLPGPPAAPELLGSTLRAARDLAADRPVSAWWTTLPTMNKGLSVAALAAGLLLGVVLYTTTFYDTAIASAATSVDTLTVLTGGQGDYL